jgi:hypothetical protein
MLFPYGSQPAGMLLGKEYKPALDEWSKSDILTSKSGLL